MNKDIERSRARVSRRRALALGGTVGLSGLIAACTSNGSSGTPTTAGTAAASTTAGTKAAAADDVMALLAQAPQCVTSQEETQGPYWFDVDSIRNDIREDRPGTEFELVLRVQDSATCTPEGGGGIANAVVEIWHCDAGGVYSGFESGSLGANGNPPAGGQGGPGGMPMGAPPEGGMPAMGEPPAGGMPPQGGPGGPGGAGRPGGDGGPGGEGSGELSDGSYSVGDTQATTTDDGTYLRGAQTTDANGVATFTTIFPGWYTGRTTHIHLKVHVNKETVLTTQLFFEPELVGEIYATSPYDEHTGWENNVTNETDGIFHESGMVTVMKTDGGYRGAINIGV